MRILVTGASGYVAAFVIPELLSAGHTVLGLARSSQSAATVRLRGAEVRRGDLDDLDGLREAAGDCDAVIHLAFKHDEQHAGDLAGAAAADLRAIGAMSEALLGSGKPLIGTTATGALALAGWQGQLTEQAALPGGPRIEAENAVVALAEQGVRSCVVRLPPSVHGQGRFGFGSGLIDVARATGTSGYAGDGSNRWPSADARDVARVYRLALESAPAGARLHAVAEEGVTLLDIATVIGRELSLPVTAVPADQVEAHFGYLAPFVSLDNPTSSQATRDLLGWAPDRPGLLVDLAAQVTANVPSTSSATA